LQKGEGGKLPGCYFIPAHALKAHLLVRMDYFAHNHTHVIAHRHTRTPHRKRTYVWVT